MNDLVVVRKRTTATVLAATAAMGSTAVAVINPADAAAKHPSQSCPGQTFCEWSDSGFNGPVRWWSPNGSDSNYSGNHYSNGPSSLTLNDTVSSVWNNSGRWVKLFNDANGGGHTLCVAPGGASNLLSNFKKDPKFPTTWHNNWNDSISSHYTYGGKPSGCEGTVSDQGCSM